LAKGYIFPEKKQYCSIPLPLKVKWSFPII